MLIASELAPTRHKKTDQEVGFLCSIIIEAGLVGATGFEPATFSSRTRRATKLRYAPKMARILQKNYCSTRG